MIIGDAVHQQLMCFMSESPVTTALGHAIQFQADNLLRLTVALFCGFQFQRIHFPQKKMPGQQNTQGDDHEQTAAEQECCTGRKLDIF